MAMAAVVSAASTATAALAVEGGTSLPAEDAGGQEEDGGMVRLDP